MYKLICFPHYTCGGLLSDILNCTFSDMGPRGAISSIRHSLGKIGDSNTVLTDFDVSTVMQQLHSLPDKTAWVGTHCWPGQLPLAEFQQIVAVTTATERSQVYRWARAFHHMFRDEWGNISGMELIDKMRECAKNYLVPFAPVQHPRVYNIEFADIVDHTTEFINLVGTNVDQHTQRWHAHNAFLKEKDFWNSLAVKTFYQAQVETLLQRRYVYEPSTVPIALDP